MRAVETRILVCSAKEFGDEIRSIAKKGREGTLRQQRILAFSSLPALLSVITEKRLELLRAIRKHKPASVYQLAKIVDRDLKSVNVDLKLLVDNRLVTLERSLQGRKHVKPHVDVFKIEIIV